MNRITSYNVCYTKLLRDHSAAGGHVDLLRRSHGLLIVVDHGGDYDRITSYNVCYTKLLRDHSGTGGLKLTTRLQPDKIV